MVVQGKKYVQYIRVRRETSLITLVKLLLLIIRQEIMPLLNNSNEQLINQNTIVLTLCCVAIYILCIRFVS